MKKLSEKAKVFAALRESGEEVKKSYKLAGFKGDVNGTAPYSLDKKVRSFSLIQPDMLEKGHSVAKLTLKIAEKVLKDKDKQSLSTKEEICLKKAHELYLEQQKRTEPVINRNINMNIGVDGNEALVDLSAYRNDTGGEQDAKQTVDANFTQCEE